MELRDYRDRSSVVGGVEWWTHSEPMLSDGTLGSIFVAELFRLLRSAEGCGIGLYVEQVTISAKSREEQAVTLTPTLHSDELYGIRETAIFSILEPGWSPSGGAVFAPTLK